MPNDAKLGLILGVGLVLTVAVVFFRRDPLVAQPVPEMAAPTGSYHAVNTLPSLPTEPFLPVSATKADLHEATRSGQRHVVAEGETLFQLAQRYYGGGDKFVDIYQANRDVLKVPDPLTPGTVLFIPKGDE